MISNVIVFVYLPGEIEAVPSGTLTITEVGRQINSKFVYGNKYMLRPNAIELDPVSLTLPRRPGDEITPINQLALFGAIRDATPDAWGRRVIEKQLNTQAELQEIQYIVNSSDDRVGALDFRTFPDTPPRKHPFNNVLDLGDLMECAEKIEKEEPVPSEVLFLLRHGSSMGGARPKSVVEDEEGLWIAKFKSRSDRFDHARVEMATMAMAKKCGITVPESRVLDLPGASVYMSKRFDRERTERGYFRKHFVSALTMLGKDETESLGSSYEEICAAIARHGSAVNNAAMKIELFRRMVFNILVGNTDDHLRNHGFLREEEGYVLSPAYDVVPAPMFSSERYQHLSVGKQGRRSTVENAMSRTGIFGLSQGDAQHIVDSMVSVVSGWREFYKVHGVVSRDIETLEAAFRKPVFPPDDERVSA